MLTTRFRARDPDEAWLPSKPGAHACALSRFPSSFSLSLSLSLSLARSLSGSLSLSRSFSPSLSLSLSQGAHRVPCLDTRMARMYSPRLSFRSAAAVLTVEHESFDGP